MAEKNLDFDTVIDRRNTKSLKYDFAGERGMPEDLLPLWVADMDFKTSSYIQEALTRQAEHGIFGYSEAQEEYFPAIHDWMKSHYHHEVAPEWLVKTPGIVYALAAAVRAFTNIGDGVLIQLPVYYPFREVIEDNGRKVINNELTLGSDGRFYIDFQDFEEKIVTEKVKLYFLCNPHNPVGRVWTEEELIKIGEICCRNHVIVVSDEIHADFVFEGKHTVFAGLKKEFSDITVTCTSPSKTFNIAGLQISNIFIENHRIRQRFKKQLDASGYSQLNVMGLVACEAAYRDGGEWYQAMYVYVRDNIEFIRTYLDRNIPEVRMTKHEGTYLVWLDFRKLGLTDEELEGLIIHKAKLWLDGGKIFGKSGEGFQRINAACPRSVLTDAMERIRKAVAILKH